MSATSAAPAVIQPTHSSSRRGQSYTSSQSSKTQPASARSPSSSAHVPQRSNSQTHSHTHSHSSQRQPHQQQQQQPQQHNLGEVLPRRDYETSHLDDIPSSHRSASRDGSYAPQVLTRTESARNSAHRHSSRSGHQRRSSDMTAVAPVVTNGESNTPRTPATGTDHSDRNTTSTGSSNRRRTTITGQSGQWALGKTIGQGSMGKVKLAKKVDTGEQVAVKIIPRQTPDDDRGKRDRERQDHSKEVRAAREAAIVSLLDHPYICGMRDVVRTHFHWYMLFEYVNGGQMLDYIISHGRLKEKQARKFSRQIASALDYCHRNSIVHRDLKIENILISKTGDIKIIDFGLSNLFSPKNQLKTFCGSLYFAAPELLQARQYTGPEVDVWSFGIVLYVLVCGKVPFDDQSMPQLHAKIKKGTVDYPQWLSAECKNLISRMLVTEPRQRANLQEIMSHPWMCKGFSSHLENYLPAREALQLPLDPEVINCMTGFDFGPPEIISNRLTQIVTSDEYQSAIRAAARDQSAQPPGGERRRGFASFDFYKRRNSTTSRDTLTNPSAEAVQVGIDPISAYSPLISIYHLVKEKQERQRQEASPGASHIPKSPGEQPLKVPDLPAPAAAHTNTSTYEMPGEAATGGRARPRARTHGEDDITETMKNVNLGNLTGAQAPSLAMPPVEQVPAKKESTAAGLLRRLSTRRYRESDKEKQGRSSIAVTTAAQKPAEAAGLARKSFSVRRAREREAPPVSMPRSGGSQSQQQDLLTPPETADARPRRGPNLGRSTSVNSGDVRRSRVQRVEREAPPSIVFHEPPLTSGSDRSSTDVHRQRTSERSPHGDDLTSGGRVATMRARSLGHARRASIQARRGRRDDAKEADVPEETDQELAASGGSGEVAQKGDGAENARPVYLKGLFSVSTTSPKPIGAIRAEIIRVLRQLGVEFTEMRGGFKCKHTPSIDLNKVQESEPPASDRTPSAIFSSGNRRRISFGGFMSGADRDEFREQPKSPNTPRTPSRRHGYDTSPTFSEGSDMSVGKGPVAAGETTTHVQSELGGTMVLNFEIIIVKVPILALHGLQFKRMAGGTWQYKNMADKILKELRL